MFACMCIYTSTGMECDCVSLLIWKKFFFSSVCLRVRVPRLESVATARTTTNKTPNAFLPLPLCMSVCVIKEPPRHTEGIGDTHQLTNSLLTLTHFPLFTASTLRSAKPHHHYFSLSCCWTSLFLTTTLVVFVFPI